MLASKRERTPSKSAWLSQASVQMISRASPSKFAVAGCAKLKIGASITRQTATYPTPMAARRSDRRRGDSAAMRLRWHRHFKTAHRDRARRRRVEPELVGANPPRRGRWMKPDRPPFGGDNRRTDQHD